jgi:hypothetical protein
MKQPIDPRKDRKTYYQRRKIQKQRSCKKKKRGGKVQSQPVAA